MARVKTTANKAHRADRALSYAAGKHRDTPVMQAIGTASEIADQPPLVTINLATMAAGLVLRRPTVVRTGLRMLAAHALATGIKTVVKRSVNRTRPKAAMDGKGYRLEHGDSHDHDLNSFPSGHTAGAVAVAGAIAHGNPGAALPAYGTAATIAAVQLPRGTHYASDIAAGAVIGWVAQWATNVALDAGEAAVRRGWREWAEGKRLDPPLRDPAPGGDTRSPSSGTVPTPS